MSIGGCTEYSKVNQHCVPATTVYLQDYSEPLALNVHSLLEPQSESMVQEVVCPITTGRMYLTTQISVRASLGRLCRHCVVEEQRRSDKLTVDGVIVWLRRATLSYPYVSHIWYHNESPVDISIACL